jgi:hypothetical protein
MVNNSEPRLPIVLYPTDTWVVLIRGPRAFGPFANSMRAKTFATCHGGIALTWHEPEWVTLAYPPDEGAIWFNNDWTAPRVVGPFYDCENLIQSYPIGDGIAVVLEMPDDHWDGDDDDELPVANNDNGDTGELNAA